ncbi:hypothetical protein [Affinirhizobium pseudoryzae]|jgi:hypothetical protein|uniref:hypothetical protein n=1 Tax=Allorhizobium pseudoryzae TaxID=379684 RepID=UPI001F18C36C|nr:hypothetical protein [Allorhizobium pseudoryzae]
MKQFTDIMSPRLSSGVLAAVSVLAMATGALAQAQNTTPTPQTQTDNCVARPDQDPQAQQRDVPGGTTQKLANCDSVLKPPAVGDPEMVEPAPSVGDTPVIKPGDLPPEQSEQTPLKKS